MYKYLMEKADLFDHFPYLKISVKKEQIKRLLPQSFNFF